MYHTNLPILCMQGTSNTSMLLCWARRFVYLTRLAARFVLARILAPGFLAEDEGFDQVTGPGCAPMIRSTQFIYIFIDVSELKYMYVLCLTFNDLSHVRVYLSGEWCVYVLYTKRYTLSLHRMARADQVRGHMGFYMGSSVRKCHDVRLMLTSVVYILLGN